MYVEQYGLTEARLYTRHDRQQEWCLSKHQAGSFICTLPVCNPTSAMPAAVFSDLGRREIASSRFLHESDQTWSPPAIGEVMFRLQHDYDETTGSRTYSDIRSSFVCSSENMRWKTDSEMRVVCGVRCAVESLTIDLANDFTYVPIPLTAILAGHEQRLGKA